MIQSEKKELRKKMRETQKACLSSLSEKEKFSLAGNFCKKITSLSEYKKAKEIFAYIPDSTEADCIPVLLDALKNGKRVAVPKVDFDSLKTGENKMDFYFLENRFSDCARNDIFEQLETGAYGIKEPKDFLEKFELEACRLKTDNNREIFVIVPGVAFTQSGKRLGHGKGFYDIYIARLKKAGIKPFLCGLCLPCQIVGDLPTDENDALMDIVIF